MLSFKFLLTVCSLASTALTAPTSTTPNTTVSSTPSFEPQPLQIVEFKIESPDESVDGKGIIAINEGAAADYLFVSDTNDTMKVFFDPQTHTLFEQVNNNTKYRFNIENDVAMFSQTGNQPVSLDNDYLNYNNSINGFGACNYIKDPHDTPEEMPVISYLGKENLPHNCSPVLLKVSRIYMVL